MSGNGGFGRMYRDLGYQPGEQVCREGFLELIGGRVYADPDRAAKLFWDGMPPCYLMMGYETIRLVSVELANRRNLGRDIFCLNMEELATYEKRRDEMAPIIARRKLRWQSSRRLEMAAVVDSKTLDELGLPKKYDSASEIPGEPIAAGIATGVAAAQPALDGAFVWRVIVHDKQPHVLRLRYAGHTYEAPIVAGTRHYEEPVVAFTDSPLQSIEVLLTPMRLFNFVGAIDWLYLAPWLVAYLLICIPAVTILRSLLRVA